MRKSKSFLGNAYTGWLAEGNKPLSNPSERGIREPTLKLTQSSRGHYSMSRVWDSTSRKSYLREKALGKLPYRFCAITRRKFRVKRASGWWYWRSLPHVEYSTREGRVPDSFRSSRHVWEPEQDDVGLKAEARLNKLALADIHVKLQGARESVMGLVEGAEAGKTAKLLRQNALLAINTTRRLALETAALSRDVVKAVRSGTPGARRKAIANRYLEYTYGVAPLLGTLDAANHLFNNPPAVRHVDVKSVAKDEVVRVTGGRSNVTPASYFWESTMEYQLTVRYAARIELGEFDGGRLSSQLGLTPSAALPAIWELIPYSFLLDYVVNIGKVVTAINNSLLSIRGVFAKSVKFSCTEQCSWHYIRSAPNPVIRVHGESTSEENRGMATGSKVSYTRSILQELPIPGVGLAALDLGLSDKVHALNALVLGESFRQREDSRLKRFTPAERRLVREALQSARGAKR